MKIRITEQQYRFLIESEKESDPLLFDFTKVYKSYENDPDMWDEIFEQKNKLNIKNGGKKYDGYYINSDINLSKSKVTELNYLVKVGGSLDFYDTPITELPMLSTVGGDLYLHKTQIKELPMLSTVGGYLDLYKTQIKELPMLSTVGGYLDLYKTQIESLPMLSTVGGDLDLTDTPLGEELKKTMSKEEVKNKFGTKGNLYL
jgi:hypothetical protein